MPPEIPLERRKSDVDLTEIKVNIAKIATLQEVYVEEIKICRGETTDQGKAIASIKVKQNIITWLGSVGVIAVVGNIIRSYFKTP